MAVSGKGVAGGDCSGFRRKSNFVFLGNLRCARTPRKMIEFTLAILRCDNRLVASWNRFIGCFCGFLRLSGGLNDTDGVLEVPVIEILPKLKLMTEIRTTETAKMTSDWYALTILNSFVIMFNTY